MLNKIIFSFSLCLIVGSTLAQVCNSNMVTSTPTSRFIIQENNDSVLDTKTNLIWKRCSEGQSWNGSSCSGIANSYTWQGALSAIQYSWRLPNINELKSIIEYSCQNPAINLTIFPDVTSTTRTWSNSASTTSGTTAWSIGFFDGVTLNYPKNYDFLQIRLVRNEQ